MDRYGVLPIFGNSSVDLGYFLEGACTIEDRRNAERRLVEGYCAALELPSDDRPSFDDVWLRYRGSTARGLTMWLVTAASDWQRPEISLTLAERYAAAFVDSTQRRLSRRSSAAPLHDERSNYLGCYLRNVARRSETTAPEASAKHLVCGE